LGYRYEHRVTTIAGAAPADAVKRNFCSAPLQEWSGLGAGMATCRMATIFELFEDTSGIVAWQHIVQHDDDLAPLVDAGIMTLLHQVHLEGGDPPMASA
jgi:hypothetical protein